MSDLNHTIKLIMDYISKKKRYEINHYNINPHNSTRITIKKDLFFRNHMSKSMDQVYKNNRLTNLYNNYCKNNFA